MGCVGRSFDHFLQWYVCQLWNVQPHQAWVSEKICIFVAIATNIYVYIYSIISNLLWIEMLHVHVDAHHTTTSVCDCICLQYVHVRHKIYFCNSDCVRYHQIA